MLGPLGVIKDIEIQPEFEVGSFACECLSEALTSQHILQKIGLLACLKMGSPLQQHNVLAAL